MKLLVYMYIEPQFQRGSLLIGFFSLPKISKRLHFLITIKMSME